MPTEIRGKETLTNRKPMTPGYPENVAIFQPLRGRAWKVANGTMRIVGWNQRRLKGSHHLPANYLFMKNLITPRLNVYPLANQR
jgi:hypothetical protein